MKSYKNIALLDCYWKYIDKLFSLFSKEDKNSTVSIKKVEKNIEKAKSSLVIGFFPIVVIGVAVLLLPLDLFLSSMFDLNHLQKGLLVGITGLVLYLDGLIWIESDNKNIK